MQAESHNRLCLSLHYRIDSLGMIGLCGCGLSMTTAVAWKAAAGNLQRMMAAHVFSSFGS